LFQLSRVVVSACQPALMPESANTPRDGETSLPLEPLPLSCVCLAKQAATGALTYDEHRGL
jgi:hypothetical protein